MNTNGAQIGLYRHVTPGIRLGSGGSSRFKCFNYCGSLRHLKDKRWNSAPGKHHLSCLSNRAALSQNTKRFYYQCSELKSASNLILLNLNFPPLSKVTFWLESVARCISTIKIQESFQLQPTGKINAVDKDEKPRRVATRAANRLDGKTSRVILSTEIWFASIWGLQNSVETPSSCCFLLICFIAEDASGRGFLRCVIWTRNVIFYAFAAFKVSSAVHRAEVAVFKGRKTRSVWVTHTQTARVLYCIFAFFHWYFPRDLSAYIFSLS